MTDQIAKLTNRIAELEQERDYWKEQSAAIATEAAIIRDFIEKSEDDIAIDDLLNDYPSVAFYTQKETDGVPKWQKVYGKLVEYEGFKFGVYFDAMAWWIVELESGKSIGFVDEFREAETMIELVFVNIGKEKLKNVVEETIKNSEPRPSEPIIVTVNHNEEEMTV